MTSRTAERSHRRIVAALIVLLLAGTIRAWLLWAHEPLYAYANSYDETRYTSCFHLYPDRPAGVPPQLNSPEAPYSRFRFIATDDPMCYWSSELVFGGAAALIFKIDALATGAPSHSVRWIGALRWGALLALALGLSLAWLRRGRPGVALTNAALVPLLFADPGNTLYLDTFYAEWSALLAAYATLGLALLWRDEPRTRARMAWLALAAFALATSKLQHMLLPLTMAVVVLILDRVRLGRITWRASALGLGALAGLYFQFVQVQRSGPMMDTIQQYNRADVVFTAMVPFVDDPRALLAEIGIDPGCEIYSGKRAWELPDLPERTCRGLVNFTRGKEIGALIGRPGVAWRLGVEGVLALDPWVACNIGHVEGQSFQKIPASAWTWDEALHASVALRLVLLGAPLAALIALWIRPGIRRGGALLEATALTVAIMLATLAITLLGDGLADTAKQGHLVVNVALAWTFAGLMMGLQRIGRRKPAPFTESTP